MTIANAILRAVPGAFILDSGLGKVKIDEGRAAYLQRAAARGVPAVAEMTPQQFGKFFSCGEIAVGSPLLLPFVPTRVAGAALTALSSGFVASYLRAPEMTQTDGVPHPGLPAHREGLVAPGDRSRPASRRSTQELTVPEVHRPRIRRSPGGNPTGASSCGRADRI